MTTRQFEALQERLTRLVDDPDMRRTLLRQALDADTARAAREGQKYQRRIDYHHRRIQRLEFLIEAVAELRPDIENPREVPMGHLIALVEPTHPALAGQLRELVGVRAPPPEASA